MDRPAPADPVTRAAPDNAAESAAADDDLPEVTRALVAASEPPPWRFDVAFSAVRAEGETALVEGIAYPALVLPTDGAVADGDVGRIDTYRTWMAPDTLRRFAHLMLERGTGGIDSQHDHDNVGCIVESWYQREASASYPANVWVVCVRILRASTVAAVIEGKLKGFSIEFTAKYAERVVTVGGKKVRTAEILKPYPLTLSVVDKPAIRIPFASVEALPAGAARAAAARGEGADDHDGQNDHDACACQRARDEAAATRREVLITCAPDGACEVDAGATRDTNTSAAARAASITNEGTMTVKQNGAAARAEDTTTPPTPEATPAVEPPAPPAPVAAVEPPAASEAPAPAEVPATRAARAVSPELEQAHGALRAALRTLTALERETGVVPATALAPEGTDATGATDATVRAESVDWTDLMSILSKYQAKWGFCDAVQRLLWTAEGVFGECRYVSADDADFAVKTRKLAGDLRTAMEAACDEFEATMGTRSARSEAGAGAEAATDSAVRKGAAISKANKAKLTKARTCAADCMSEIDGIIGSEEEDTTQANAAPDDPSDPGVALAALRAEMETLRANHANELTATEQRAVAAADVKVAEVEARAKANAAEAEARAKTAEDSLAAARTALQASEGRVKALDAECSALRSARPAPKSAGDAASAAIGEKPAAKRAAVDEREAPSEFRGSLGLGAYVGKRASEPAQAEPSAPVARIEPPRG